MQIIESSVIGVRSARLEFWHPDIRATVTLFPMIHIAEPSFYARVYEDAFAQDVALVEGVDSPIARRITRAYRWMLGSKTLQLSLQPNPPSAPQARIVHADLTGPEFEVVWRKVPPWLRWIVYVYAMALGLSGRFRMTRLRLAKIVPLDDAPTLRELAQSPEAGALSEAILDARDRRLLERLRECIGETHGAKRAIAVVYGAGHMRAVIRELTDKLGFHTGKTEWMTVFST